MDVPLHVAIIPDGNRRWAKEKGLPAFEGHRKGAERLNELAETAKKLNIKVATFWAFSTENWNRSKEEVGMLMKLFERVFKTYIKKLIKNSIRFIHLGRKDRIPVTLRNLIKEAEEKTRKFQEHYFALALDYGGCDEIIRAVKKMGETHVPFKNLTKEHFGQFLDTKELPYPNPDLIIRTGGEMRTSGFLIWQSEYAEFISVPKYFPDFTGNDLKNCIKEYAKRQRRFGK